MSVTYGFYNSLSGDRKYNAEQISSIFDGIINDGIYLHVGNHFRVLAGSQTSSGSDNMIVFVDTGRAWLNHTWTLNDSYSVLEIDPSSDTLRRIDKIVIEVNHTTRMNSIKVLKGVPAAEPVSPDLTNNDSVHQYCLAEVRINKNADRITQSDIINKIGIEGGTPYVTGLFETLTVPNEIISEWSASFNDALSEWRDRFVTAYNNFRDSSSSLVQQYRDGLEAFWSEYTENADALLKSLLAEALSNNRVVRLYVPTMDSSNVVFPKGLGESKTLNKPFVGFENIILPSTNISVGDIIIGPLFTIAEISHVIRSETTNDITSITLRGTGIDLGFQSFVGRTYYFEKLENVDLPHRDYSITITPEDYNQTYKNCFIPKLYGLKQLNLNDLLISSSGRIARVTTINSFGATIIGCGSMDFPDSSTGKSGPPSVSLSLTRGDELRIAIDNAPDNADGLSIIVQKLVGRPNGHRWMSNPMGFYDLKSESEKYENIPIPSWMPNGGVLTHRWQVTPEIIQNGLTIYVSRWLLDALKPVLVEDGDQTDSLSGFSDGSYVALIGERLYGIMPGRYASTKKYSLDVQYRFVLVDSNDNVIGMTDHALSIPYKTFWASVAANPDRKRHVKIVEGVIADNYLLTGKYKIVSC